MAVARFAVAAPYFPPPATRPPASSRPRAARDVSEPAISPDRREIAFVSGGDIWTVAGVGRRSATPRLARRVRLAAALFARRDSARVHVDAHGERRHLCADARDGTAEAHHVRRRRPISSTRGRATAMALPVVGQQRRERHERHLPRERRRRNADGGERRPVHAGILERAVADRPEHDRVHRERAHEQRLVAHTATATSTRVRSGSRALAARCRSTRQSRRTRHAPRGRCGAATARRSTSCRIASGSENVWAKSVAGGDARALTSFKNGRLVWPTISYDGKHDRLRARLRRVVARRRERQGERDADHVARRERGDRCRASVADAGFPVARACRPTERRSRSSRTATCSPRRRETAVTRRGSRHHAGTRGRAHVGAGQPASGVHLVPRRGDAPLPLRLCDAHRDEADRRPENDVAPTWSPDGKTIAFMRGAKELRVVDVATKQDRVLATGELDRPPFLSGPTRSRGRRTAVGSPTCVQRTGRIPESSCRRVGRRAPARAGQLPAERERRVDRVESGRHLSALRHVSANGGRAGRARRSRFRARRASARISSATCSQQPTRPGTPTDPAPRQAPPQRDSATVRADSVRTTRRHARDRVRRHSPAHQHAARRRRRARRRHQSGRQDGADQRERRGPGQSLHLLARRAVRPASRSRGSSRRRPASRAIRSSPPTAERSTTSRTGGSTSINVESRQARPINVTAELDVDFAREKLAVFHQAWSILADNFFDAKMNGVDWKALGDQYEPYAAGAQSTEELRRIMRLMIGELNASHSGVNGPSFSPQANVGRLGVALRSRRLRARRKAARHRSAVAEPRRARGDQRRATTCSVDRRHARSTRTRISIRCCIYKTNRRVTLSVSRSADGIGARELAIRPVNARHGARARLSRLGREPPRVRREGQQRATRLRAHAGHGRRAR